MVVFDEVTPDYAVMLASYLLQIGFEGAKKITEEDIEKVKEETPDNSIVTAGLKEWLMRSAREVATTETEVDVFKWVQKKSLFDISPEYTLDALLDDFKVKFEKARDAREEVMGFLEDEYGIDTVERADDIEDEDNWCFGIDMEWVNKLIEEGKESADE